MPTVIVVVVVRLIVATIAALRKSAESAKPKPLCQECAFAHIQYGACGRRAIFCTFGGGTRPVALDVLYCTDYRTRHTPARPAIGFVRGIAATE